MASSSDKRNYLIVGPSWVGDMVMSQSLLKLLKHRYPDCTIDVLAPAWSLPILERMPEVRKGIALGLGHGMLGIKQRKTLGQSLISEHYTHAITLPRSWKSALVPYYAKTTNRIGYVGEQRYGLLNDWRPLDKKVLDQTVKRYLALGLDKNEAFEGLEWEYPKLQTNLENFSQLQEQLSLNKELPAVAIMPGAEYGPAKQWPLEYYRKLAEALAEKGFQIWILGSQKDAPAGEQISQSNHPSIFNLCGKTQLADTVDLLSQAQHAVTNDSGLMHVAAAVGTKVHGIYGSSSPDYTPPLTENKVIHYLNLDCSPCFERVCPLGHTNCLKHIYWGVVLKSILD